MTQQKKQCKKHHSIRGYQKTLQRAVNACQERTKITDKVGRGMYVIAAYEKIKRITIPLDNNNHILFISVDNSPLNAQ